LFYSIIKDLTGKVSGYGFTVIIFPIEYLIVNLLIKLMRLLLLILTCTMILSVSCRKDKTTPKEKFPLSYQFINEGDDNVKSVIFYAATLFPNDTVDVRGDSVDVMNWQGQAFNNVSALDILTMPSTKKGYTGCMAQLKFTIWFKKTVFSPVLFNKGYGGQNGVHPVGITEARCYEGPVKTVLSPGDNVIQFRWPSDTTNSTEVLTIN
jgi:hypothetical protein